jgi:ADP-heptose:LPS heptosyltransferase
MDHFWLEGDLRRLILKNGYSVGDIVMMTAAVRDLHRCHPGEFQTDVRTACPDLWANNPHLTPLAEAEAEVLDCDYPLINRCDETPCHCLDALPEFLNERLGLKIRVTAYRGDIHLSTQERGWSSQVRELTRRDLPFWIVAAGGKYDLPIKWWESRRYQQVVDHFRGRIQFVQVGNRGHHHPRLDGVIDLRGQTNLRELVRLVYHAQGVLCGVTALMHLAAAVPLKRGAVGTRPCVVIAGGREAVHWESYPGHQYLATNGTLPCCAPAGCWKSRVRPLGDGDERDRPESLCVDVHKGLPRCMAMITPEEVIRRIELYFEGGVARALTQREAQAAQRGVKASAGNDFDQAPLTLSGARLACEAFLRQPSGYPGGFSGRGIVICAGGVGYFPGAWVCIQRLRQLGCRLPVQVWHLGADEMDPEMTRLLAPLGVACVDASEVRQRHPARRLGGWELKPYAILHSPFKEVLSLDADNVPVRNPEFLFAARPYRETGAVFWPDYGRFEKTKVIWQSCGLDMPEGPELESGQMLVDKQRCWRPLRLALWFNEHSDFYYQHLHGDKETFRLAFHLLRKDYGWVPILPEALVGTMCQHDFQGRRVFQHRNTDKWDLHLRNRRIEGFLHEEECRQLVLRLRARWDGRMSVVVPDWERRQAGPIHGARSVRFEACVISCPERKALLDQTLQRLAATDWGSTPVRVERDTGTSTDRRQRMTRTAYRALRRSLRSSADYLLFLEDDLEFNRHLRHNLECWRPVRERRVTLASLYNPSLPELACDPAAHCSVVAAGSMYGSQALLLSREAVRYLVAHWEEAEGLQDLRMARLASRLGQPIFYHVPSLVEHVGVRSTWGGREHHARDFDPVWRAPSDSARPGA